MKLSSKIALISGGTFGIGFEAARLFREDGARVIVTGADQTRLDTASRQLGGDVLALPSDVRIPDVWSPRRSIRERRHAARRTARSRNRTAVRRELQRHLLYSSKSRALHDARRQHCADNIILERCRRARPVDPLSDQGSGAIPGAVHWLGVSRAWHAGECGQSRPDRHPISRQTGPLGKGLERSSRGDRSTDPPSSLRRSWRSRQGSAFSRQPRCFIHGWIRGRRGRRIVAVLTKMSRVQ